MKNIVDAGPIVALLNATEARVYPPGKKLKPSASEFPANSAGAIQLDHRVFFVSAISPVA